MPTLQAVTLDFHDTLFQCDDWFQLEVQTLAPAVLRWWASRGGPVAPQTVLDAAQRAYRALRREIIRGGEEREAASCALHACRMAGVELDPVTAQLAIADLMGEALRSAMPMPGAGEAVFELRRQGLSLAVISNAIYHPFLLWALDRHGLLGSFESVLTSASTGFYKSRPEIYRLAAAALDVDPARALHVGDSYEYDVVGAVRAGLRAGWLRRAAGREDHAPADFVIADLGELPTAAARLDDSLARSGADAH